MPIPRRNRRSRRVASSRRVLLWGGIGLFGVYLTFFLVFGRMGVLAHLRMSGEAERIDSEIARVRGEIGELSREVDALNRDPHTIERLARERLGMVRPGETVFLFPDRPSGGAPAREARKP
jgi:cell division protein FtsB